MNITAWMPLDIPEKGGMKDLLYLRSTLLTGSTGHVTEGSSCEKQGILMETILRMQLLG